MPLTDPFRERYLTDPMVHHLVDAMAAVLLRGDLNALDLARCAVLAAQLYAERYGAPMLIIIQEGKPPEIRTLADHLRDRHG